MKQAIKIFLLSTLALTAVLYACVQLLAQDGPDNYFNNNIRPKISTYPFWRNVFFFKDYGDARSDYLKSATKIRFNIYSMEGISVDESIFSQMIEEVARLTSKPTTYRLITNHIPYDPILTVSEQDVIIDQYKQGNVGDFSDVYVFILSQLETDPELLGITSQHNGMVIYYDAIKLFTGENKTTTPLYTFSTVLHEFGHLLGMEHTTDPGCLMLEHAEESRAPKLAPQDVIHRYCAAEQNQIKY